MKVLDLGEGIFMYKCPGCRDTHFIYTKTRNSSNAIWKFNGDVNSPTFKPSINYTTGYMIPRKYLKDDEYNYYKEENIGSRCHSFVQNGVVNFCGDCTHSMNGKQGVTLPEITKEQIESWQIYKRNEGS